MFKPNLSQTSKLGCKSWSLQAKETCPGSVGPDGDLVDACKGCYATQGAYNFPGTKAVRATNKEEWQREDWVPSMVAVLKNQSHFRWFDSGDMYSLQLAYKIYQVMKLTPWCKHWLPTRMHKFSKYRFILWEMSDLPNVRVRRSSDSITGAFTEGFHGSTIVESGDHVPAGVTLCNAPKQGGKCLDCRACWDKEVPVVAYVAHQKAIKKLYMMKKAA